MMAVLNLLQLIVYGRKISIKHPVPDGKEDCFAMSSPMVIVSAGFTPIMISRRLTNMLNL